jgi:hypothetical protein
MSAIAEAAGAVGYGLLKSSRINGERTTEYFCEFLAHGQHARDRRIERDVLPLLRQRKVVTDQDLDALNEMGRLQKVCLSRFAVIGFRAAVAQWGFSIQRTLSQNPFEAGEVALLEPISDRLTKVATLSASAAEVGLTTTTAALERGSTALNPHLRD